MATTLVQKLKEIDKIPDFVKVDKTKESRTLLDEYRRRHPLVDKAARGEISFSDIVDKLYEKHKGVKIFLPRFKDNEYDKKLDELNLNELVNADSFRTDTQQRFSKEIPYYYGQFLGWFYDKMANPIVLPVLMGGITALTLGGQGRFESNIANYSAQFGGGALFGLIFGLIATLMKYEETSTPIKQATYLSAKIQEAYRS